MEKKKLIRDIVTDKADIISGINQSVWDFVEFGYHEERSTEKVKGVLLEEGSELESGLTEIATSSVGRYGNGRPVIGILVEYDALPDLSQEVDVAKSCPIKGKEHGHGCGHSALGTGVVGTAIVVEEYLKQTGQTETVELYGCSAEETGFGKTFMVKAYCFDDLDMTFCWHPMDGNISMSAGTVAYYKARFDLKGRTSHAGAAPELGRSALDACELMNVGVNYLREYIISNARVHHAYVDCGGKTLDMAPDHASLLYFVRALELKQSGEILERIKKITQGAASITETEVEIQVLGGASDTIPNPTASKLLVDSFVETGAPDFGKGELTVVRKSLDIMPEEQKARVIAEGVKRNGINPEEFARRSLNMFAVPYMDVTRNRVMTGSSDVGDVSYQVPIAQTTAAAGVPETGAHTWQMMVQVGTSIGDKVSLAVARAIALACAKVYEGPAIVEQAKKELLEETGGVYISLIPDGIVSANVE